MIKGLEATQALSIIEVLDTEEQMRAELATATVAELRAIFEAFTNREPMRQLKKHEIIGAIVYNIIDEREREAKVKAIENLPFEERIDALMAEEDWFVRAEVIEHCSLMQLEEMMKILNLPRPTTPKPTPKYIPRTTFREPFRRALRDYFTEKRGA